MHNSKPEKPKASVGDSIIVNRTQVKGVIENLIGSTKVVAKLETGTVLIMEHKDYHLVQVPKKVKIGNLRALIDCALLVGDQGYFMELTERLNAVMASPEDPAIRTAPSKKPAGTKPKASATDKATDKAQEARVAKQRTKEMYSAIIDLGLSMRDYALVDEYRKLLHEGDL